MGDSVLGHERHLLLDPHDPLSDLSGLKCDSAKARVQELLSIKGVCVCVWLSVCKSVYHCVSAAVCLSVCK